MFTLGNKEAIVNSANKFKVTNAGVDTFASNVATLEIAGFGSFHKDQIVSGSGNRYVAGAPGALVFAAPTAAELGLVEATDLNVAVVMHLRLLSSRDASEWANDFIKRGRPFIIELTLNYGETADQVADKIIAAFTQYESSFNLSAGLPFTFAKNTENTGVYIQLVGKYDDLAFTTNVEFTRRFETFGVKATEAMLYARWAVTGATSLADATTVPVGTTVGVKVGDKLKIYDVSADAFIARELTVLTVASATEVTVAAGTLAALEATDVVYISRPGEAAINDGKYLEENVKMGTFLNATPYALNNGEVPIIGGSYTQITWTAKATDANGVAKTWQPHKNLAIVAAGAEVGTRNQTFTLYFNEDSSLLGSGGTVEVLVDWLIDTVGITAADFKIANGSSPIDGATFVA